MKCRILILFIISLIAGCAGNEEEGVLVKEPFKPLTDSLQQTPNNAYLYYRRGSLLFQNDLKTLAEKDLRKAWQLQPTETHALSVVTVLVDKNRDSALQFISQALKLLPESVSLQISLARGYQQKGQLEEALKVTNAILDTYPNSLDALLLKSEILKAMNREGEALASLEKAYMYAPFDAELAYNLAFSYAETKNSKALQLTDSLIRMDTSERHAEPYYIKAVYFDNLGNTAQAIRFYDEAIKHDYNFLDAYMDKGKLLYEQKNYTGALKTFNLPVTITPSFADAYFWIGKCHQALNNKEEAKLAYQRAYGLDKTLTEAKAAADKL